MVSPSSILFETALCIALSNVLASDDVSDTCLNQSRNWTPTSYCASCYAHWNYSMCGSCKDWQVKCSDQCPFSMNASCGTDRQIQNDGRDCPRRSCSYCLACNTSDVAVLETLSTEKVAVCRNCYLEDTIFWAYNSTFTGDIGACRVNVSCHLLLLNGSQVYSPVLASNPDCSHSISGTPNLTSVDPARGPIAGGTILTITGKWLTKVSRVTAGEIECDTSPFRCNNNDSRLLCRTSSASTAGEVVLKIEIPVWPVTWVNSSVTFEFKPNPQVTSVIQASSIAAGGIKISFLGQNLRSSEKAELLVAVFCNHTGEFLKNFTSECLKSDNETNLDCLTPDVSEVSDSLSCNSSNIKGTTETANSSYSRFDFYIGLIFDGYLNYSCLASIPYFGKNGFFQISDNMNIYRFEEDHSVKKFDPISDSTITIRGEAMNVGAKIGDYKVFVGGNSPCHVQSLESKQLTCKPPKQAPSTEPDIYVNFECLKKVNVTVTVGNLRVLVGYLCYKTNLLQISLLATLIPEGTIIIAVVAAIVCVKRRRQLNGITDIFGKRDAIGSRLSNEYFSKKGRQKQRGTVATELPQRLRVGLALHRALRSEVSLKEIVGQGHFGKIYQADFRGKTVAAKVLKDDSASVDDIAKFLQEALLMKDFHHPNVIGLCGVVLDIEQPMILVEMMDAGDLRTAIKREEFPFGDLVNFCAQIANGMVYLSAKKYIHRDLAARNCLLDQSYCLKIGDFGLSHELDIQDYYRCKDRTKPVPVKWMALESLASGLFTTASDVWSYGVVMWEVMSSGHVPYFDVSSYDMTHYLRSGRRLDCPPGTPDALYEIMRLCWNAVPSNRPTFEEILLLLSKFTSVESTKRDLKRRFTKNVPQEVYSYAAYPGDEPTAFQYSQLNEPGYLEVFEIL